MYITGETKSTNFPTLNPYQDSLQVFDNSDIFITKLSSDGNSLIYSTYLGGSTNDHGGGIAVDASGAAYVTGYTYSSDFPMFNPYIETKQGGADAFVTKLSSSGNSLIYSTYFGGSTNDFCSDITVDASEAVYIAGMTYSIDFPTLNPYQGTNQGGGTYGTDAFVTKLSSSGNSLIYSTYLGGNHTDNGYSIAVDISGAAYVTGYTRSTDFPTLNPYQGINHGYDVFVTKLSSDGSSLVYSTYLGGSSSDIVFDITVDISGAAYITGYTYSTDFPMFNPYQGTNQGGVDAFVTGLDSSGSSLIFSTYLGGSITDEGHCIVVNTSGTVYLTGHTTSADFPTLNPYNGINQGGNDVFVTKISTTDLDSDGDWIADENDNCPNTPNPMQIDIDGDGVGDVCDSDDDNDGVDDASDADPLDPSICEDIDADGCDDCSVGTDGFGPLADNDTNNDGLDTDSDGLCDAGDSDDDNDGILDDGDGSGTAGDNPCSGGATTDCDDNCPTIPNSDQADLDGDGVGDACDSGEITPPFIVLDSVIGMSTDSMLYTNSSITFLLQIKSSSDSCAGISNGFRIYSPDGAEWGTTSGDTINYAWKNYFDLMFVINPYSTDGAGADTIGFAGSRLFNQGLLPNSDFVGFTITIGPIDNSHIGKTIVLDSSLFGLYGSWTWAEPVAYPNWGGPYTFTIAENLSCCINFRGNVDNDALDQIDISDLVFLVAYMFSGGTEPSCFEEADIDGSDGIDISDLVGLVAYMFSGGAEPVVCP